MSGFNHSSKQITRQTQAQTQSQRLSQKQITALNFLSMSTNELRDEINKALSENPALQIVSGSKNKFSQDFGSHSRGSMEDADKYQQMMENSEDRTESLQEHLMFQLNASNISKDEFDLSQKLIYNLDKNGCYGSSISPETLLDKTRPLQNEKMLKKCIDRIQRMDPIGTCCKTLEESLYIQAKISGNASPLTLFILNGNLQLIESTDPKKILRKITDYRENWHKKDFATELPIDNIKLSEDLIEESIKFILKLNPRPAQGFTKDTMSEFEQPDVVLAVEKVNGGIISDDFSKGLVACDGDVHFQVKYASGVLPELAISNDFAWDKENYEKARNLIDILAYRESTIVLQGCAIVSAQKGFFLKGIKGLVPLTRRQIAEKIGVHESTVSRFSGKHGNKFIQTEFGALPVSYFFSSGISTVKDENVKISSEVIKLKMQEIIAGASGAISDAQLTEILNRKGVKIARRTVAKYRLQLGILNSYKR